MTLFQRAKLIVYTLQGAGLHTAAEWEVEAKKPDSKWALSIAFVYTQLKAAKEEGWDIAVEFMKDEAKEEH